MPKEIVFDSDARGGLAAGVDKLASAVRVTIGPSGRYVAMQKERSANVSNDGATVAANVDLEDHVENVGMKVVREAAIAANNEAGDGTTTATILADALVREGVRAVAAGAEPLALRRGIQAAADAACEALLRAATPVTTREQYAEIASVSSGSPEIGDAIAGTFAEIGTHGVISVEKSQVFGLSVNFLRGMVFDRGFISPQMADDMGKLTGELHQPYILITSERLADNVRDIVPVLEEVIESGHPLLVIADDVRGEALGTLLANRQRGTLESVAVQCPGAEERRKAELEDLAVLTGGEVISPERGLSLADARKSMLGRAQDVQISQKRTLIVGGKGKAEAIEARCKAIQKQLEQKTLTEYDRGVLEERLAKLQGNIAVMKVGAATESEMEEMRSRIQDALRAVRSAAEQGLVAGGGVALLQAARALDGVSAFSADEERGVAIMRRALEEPLRALAANAGIEGGVAVARVQELPCGQGINFANGGVGDMVEMGIADPAKVACTALQAAASVASMILITECVVAEKE